MIELHDVWKGMTKATTRDAWTLAGVTLTIPAGLRIAMFGVDATDNSLALRVLSGVEAPDRGAIRREGAPCWPLDFFGFVDMQATVKQNINFLAQVYGVSASDMARIVTRLGGAKEIKGRPISQYLAHDRRGFSLAMTLSLQFDWYFVDEKLPRGRDPVAVEVEAVIADRLSRGSVIWATTKPELLEGYCNAALLLDQGSLTFYSDFHEAVDAFQRVRQAKSVDEAKPRKAGRRGRAPRSPSPVDTENAG